MLRFSQLVFVILALQHSTRGDEDDLEQLLLTVFYESQCSDSREFISEQLQPALELLHEYITLELVPFGKAHSVKHGKHGFKCQHGPTECDGNLVQSCTLDLMQGRSDLEKVSYVDCEMRTEAGTQRKTDCAVEAGVLSDEVEECIYSDKGMSLQLEAEQDTKLLKPSFIPTITIDEIYNQEVQDSAMKDLTGTLCSMLNNTPPCEEYYNTMAMSYVLV